eukprot:5876807-Amphidinium_carterae.1
MFLLYVRPCRAQNYQQGADASELRYRMTTKLLYCFCFWGSPWSSRLTILVVVDGLLFRMLRELPYSEASMLRAYYG